MQEQFKKQLKLKQSLKYEYFCKSSNFFNSLPLCVMPFVGLFPGFPEVQIPSLHSHQLGQSYTKALNDVSVYLICSS